MTRAAGTLLGAAVLLFAACAHVEAPTGGPEDEAPPELVVSRPATGEIVRGGRTPVVFVFDERISERGIDLAVEVSPRTSGVVVRHSGDELRVSLRDGWRSGTIYHVNVLPGLRDLFSNATTASMRLVFSTGPEIPETRATGVVVDRTTREPMPDLRVEAIRTADSLVYAAVTDSLGSFIIAQVPEGDYLVRAYEDMNSNRALDAFEPRDTVRRAIVAADSVEVRLSVVLPDTTAPVVASARIAGRLVTLTSDDFLDPARVVPVEDVAVVGPSGERLPVARVAVGELAEPRDTALAGDTAIAAPGDTAVVEPLPSQSLIIELAEEAALVPGAEYTITVSGVRNIVGLVADVTTTATAPDEAGTAEVPGGDVAPAPEGASIAENPNRYH